MAGLYFHIPFCRKKCSYCDFHFSTNYKGYRKNLVDQLRLELIDRLDEIKKTEEISTIYFGGGTPSILTILELQELFSAIRMNFSLSERLEVTLEVNPEDIEKEKLNDWYSLGINRLSMGVQSLDDDLLQKMNRNHNAKNAITALNLIDESRFTNYSLDLIYGIPGQSDEILLNTLHILAQTKATHLSAYSLTIEPKTAFHNWIAKGKMSDLNEDQQIHQFYLVRSTLHSYGFEDYEISNFCRNNNFAAHNTNYWMNYSYIGIGPGAHSYNGIQRRWNRPNNTTYINQKNWFSVEVLSENDKWNEFILTRLRTKWGINQLDLERIGGFNEKENKLITKLLATKKIINNNGVLSLTDVGKIEADGISASLFRIN